MPDQMGGPYVSVAAFCQTALTEATRQLSIIRIQDQIVVPIPKFPAGTNFPEGFSIPIAPAQITMVIVLKSGIFKGKAMIKMQPISPTGAELPVAQFPTLLEGEERGLQIVMPMAIVFQEEGVYWFEIGLENPPLMLTKVPLRVIHHEVPIQQMGAAPKG